MTWARDQRQMGNKWGKAEPMGKWTPWQAGDSSSISWGSAERTCPGQVLHSLVQRGLELPGWLCGRADMTDYYTGCGSLLRIMGFSSQRDPRDQEQTPLTGVKTEAERRVPTFQFCFSHAGAWRQSSGMWNNLCLAKLHVQHRPLWAGQARGLTLAKQRKAREKKQLTIAGPTS